MSLSEDYMPPEWAGDILDKARKEIGDRGGDARKEVVVLTMMLDKLLDTKR